MVNKVKADGQTALSVSDHGVLYGHIDLYQKATKAGIKPIIACEMYQCENHLIKGEAKKGKKAKEEETAFLESKKLDKDRFHLTILAENQKGYQNLLKLVTISNKDGYYYKPRIDKGLLKLYGEGLIILSGCLGSEINQYIINDMMEEAENAIKSFIDIFSAKNFFLEVMNHDDPLEDKVRAIVPKLAKKYGLKIVATNDAHYVNKEDSIISDAIIALRDDKKIDDPELKKYRNNSYYLKTKEEMSLAFPDNPEYLEEAFNVGERCNVVIKNEKLIFPEFISGEEKKKQLLTENCRDGWKQKLHNIGLSIEQKKVYADRVKYELEVITKNNFSDYFLIVSDICRKAKELKIRMGSSRGSCGGSLVSYLLGITKLDPIADDLSFERFLNESRLSPPDIDLDFQDDRRDEIIEYVKNKYGADNFCKVLTFGNYQPKAALRDSFKVFGHPISLQMEMTDLVPSMLQGIPNIRFKHLFGLDPDFPEAIQPKLIAAKEKYPKEFYLAEKLEGNPRHASTHASAYILTDKPITEYAPLDRDNKNDEMRLGIDMYSGEYIKLLKMDFLGIETLSILDKAIKLVEQTKKVEIDTDKIAKDNKLTWDLFKKGDTIGIFQFESDGMRGLLKKAQPCSILELADCNAIYRPGAAKFIDEYVAVKHKRQKPNYFHPSMEPVLESTQGVMIFQEQCSKMCELLAGFTKQEADAMRAAIGKKNQDKINALKPKFIAGCKKNGIDEQLVDKIISWFADMSRYNFNKSHADGYSTDAYNAAYVKANYPLEFYVAMLNKKTKELDDYKTRYQDALKHGVKVNGPNINKSMKECVLVNQEIYFGLDLIKGVSSDSIDKIIEERQKNGVFTSINQFLQRAFLLFDKGSIAGLVYSGSLDALFASTGPNQRVIIESLDTISKAQTKLKTKLKKNPSLEYNISEAIEFQELEDFSPQEKMEQQKESIGFFVGNHPLTQFSKWIDSQDFTEMNRIQTKIDGEYVTFPCIITKSEDKLDKNKNTMAFLELEDESNKVRGIVFSSNYEKNKSIIKKLNVPVLVSGKATRGQVAINNIKIIKEQ